MKSNRFIKYILILSCTIKIYCLSIKSINTTVTEKVDIINVHLNIEHIQKVCENRVAICKSNDTSICAVRLLNGKMDFLDFENSCFLFLNNMCDNYGREYSIVSSGTCFEYFKTRRSYKPLTEKTTPKALRKYNITRTDKPNLRNQTEFSTLYEVDTSFDYHTCPLACPDVYSPVCVTVNKGYGLYYKFFTFVNHCEGDLYYCKHWREFSPPPDENEMVRVSKLSWSYCAANRYIQFARFTEMTSSMGHYGWLAGDYRPTHIMEPHQRMPGYGK